MLRDMKLGARMMLRSKGWTTVVLLMLALGIGANTALFSAINGLLLRTLAVQEPSKLVRIGWSGDNQMAMSRSEYGSTTPLPDGRRVHATFSHLIYQRLTAANETLGGLTSCAPAGRVNVVVDGQAELALSFVASGSYFKVLGVGASVGRTITPDDDRPEAPPVAMISHGYWERRFGGDIKAVGKVVLINNQPVTIVGVTGPDYSGIQRLGESAADIHLPLSLHPAVSGSDRLSRGTWWWLQIVGRLKPGVTPAQVKGNLDGVFKAAAREGWDSYYSQLSDEERGLSRHRDRTAVPELQVNSAERGIYSQSNTTSRTFSILSVVVGIILLIVCANVANLQLSRAALRAREMSIRSSLGSTRIRLIRQLLTESLLLSLTGAALGLVVAFWSRRLLPIEQGAPLDWRVFLFTAGVAVITGLIFGIIPALKVTQVNLATAFKENSRSISRSRTWIGKSLLILQVAMSVLLLIGAGLFLRTLSNLRHVEVGFNPENVLLVTVDAGVNQYENEKATLLFQEMQSAFETVPGVQSVSLALNTFLSGSIWTGTVHVDGSEGLEQGNVHMMTVSPGFFETLEIPLLTGRVFGHRDQADAPLVAIINQTAARELFGEENPVGRRLGFSPENRNQIEVVGVVVDSKYSSLREAAPATVFRPYLQRPRNRVTFVLRTNLPTRSVTTSIRSIVTQIDPNLPLADISTQAEEVEERLSQERLFARSLTLFGGLALLLASVGLFGLMSYAVVRRTNEIGIRMALGADHRKVVAMVIRESLQLVMVGCLLGLAAAVAAGRLIASVLYGLAPTDPVSIAGALALMVLVSLCASYLPARRASRIDPVTALHYE